MFEHLCYNMLFFEIFNNTKLKVFCKIPTPLKRGFFKKSTNFQKIMEKGEARYEKLVFFLHYHLNAYYVAQIIL
jgi:hypothetical protein